MISDCVSRHLEVGEMATELVILASALGRINIPYRKYSSLLVVFTLLCMHEKKKSANGGNTSFAKSIALEMVFAYSKKSSWSLKSLLSMD